MCWGKKKGESDTSRTPKGSAGSIWSLRSCLDGCSAGLDGLGAGIGSTHPEVGHDDTGNDNESSFHDHSEEESQKQAPAPLGQRSCPWRVGRVSVSTPESAVHLRSWHAPGMQPRLLAAFFDAVEKDLTARAPNRQVLPPNTFMDGALTRPPWTAKFGCRHLIVSPSPGRRPPSQVTVTTRNV